MKSPFSYDISYVQFINDYFTRAEKKYILRENKSDKLSKANHAVSIFFLGILFYKKLNISKKDILQNHNKSETPAFSFYWFLICFYHDYGMSIENNKDSLEKYTDIDLFKDKLEICYDLLKKEDVKDCPEVLFTNIRNYFYYRRFYWKKIDHGIWAGLYLYDQLVRNRKKNEDNDESELYWGRELDKDYATIAAAIACHNIWFPQNDKAACDYIKFDMKSLIDPEPISFQESPLLYLLGIVDTIDPTKAYEDSQIEERDILKNIKVDFNGNDSVTFKVDDSKLDPNKLLDQSKYLDGWLDVGINKTSNSLTITLSK